MQGKESRPYSLEDYEKVISLKKGGLSQRKVSEITGASSATVWHWINTLRKPRFLYAKKQQRIILDSAKELSIDLAYILGVLIGDGYLEATERNKRIGLFVKDRDFAFKFCDALKNWSGLEPIVSTRRVSGNHKTKYGNWIKYNSLMYDVRLNSVQAIHFLKPLIKCGTYDWEVPSFILSCRDEKIICAFIKGIFDSEGSVEYSGRTRRVEATILNPNNNLQHVQDLLERVGIQSTLRLKSKIGSKVYAIYIAKRASIELFYKKISFTIKRKRVILEKILRSYVREPYDGEETRRKILVCLKKKPKTINDLAEAVGKHYNTITYHLKLISNVEKETSTKSRLWSVK